MIVGIDLSLRRSGMVAVPEAWDLDWTAVRTATAGYPLGRSASTEEHIGRLRTVSGAVVAFVREHDAKTVALEEYAFAQRGAGSREIAELGGVVKVALAEAGVEVRIVTASAARKLLLGAVPRAGAKAATFEALRAMGATFETDDEADAFALANWLSAELGGVAVTLREAA